MNAGRETDVLVGKQVMGLDVQQDQVTRGAWADKQADDPWDYFVGASNERVPAFSASMAAAWPVVERIVADGGAVQLLNVSGEWRCSIAPRGEMHSEAFAKTAALAICEAALKAVGAEVPG